MPGEIVKVISQTPFIFLSSRGCVEVNPLTIATLFALSKYLKVTWRHLPVPEILILSFLTFVFVSTVGV